MTYTTGADSDSVSVVDNGRSLKQVGLIVLDGEEISADRLSQLDPSRIDAMTVLKGEQGVERYGEKGAEGVIEITTKKIGAAWPANEYREVPIHKCYCSVREASCSRT